MTDNDASAVHQTVLAAGAVVAGTLVTPARFDLNEHGKILWSGAADDAPTPLPWRVRCLGPSLVVPGFVNAHSHAFQRAIRGQTQRAGPDDFWSWRTAMYAAAAALTPDTLHTIASLAFGEMLARGIVHVGEFHYVHHDDAGKTYADPDAMSLAIVAAAREVGIGLTLLETYYERSHANAPAAGAQLRFCDGNVAAYLARVERLLALGVDVGLAPHSVRAVTEASLRALASAAREMSVPVHMHVSEQPLENEQCVAEHGCSPTQLLARTGMLDVPMFTAVHATHIEPADRARLASHTVCVCPTTEADLGDGLVHAQALLDDGVSLALGSDSNAIIDLIQEARLLDMHERLRSMRRLWLADAHGTGLQLLQFASRGGARALGLPCNVLALGDPFDAAVIDLRHRTLAGIALEHVVDAVMCSGTGDVVRETFVSGIAWRPKVGVR